MRATTIRLTDEQMTELGRRAAAAGYDSREAYMRAVLLSGPPSETTMTDEGERAIAALVETGMADEYARRCIAGVLTAMPYAKAPALIAAALAAKERR
jgi:hypothetical protein